MILCYVDVIILEPMYLVDKKLMYFTIPSWTNLNSNLCVGFSTRNGGYSRDEFSSMNLALHVDDVREDVIANRKLMSSALNFAFNAWTCAEQVHYNNIEIISESDRGRGRLDRNSAIPSTDGLITDVSDILLTSFYADCVPIYFFDPIKNVIGLAHAGWKGTMLKIGEKMITKMLTVYNSNINDIRVAIGPSIGLCCYEVDNNVVEPLLSTIGLLPKEILKDNGNGYYNLDIKKVNALIIEKAGIQLNNIEVSSLCTSCNIDLFYSHRKEKGKTGRMASWIGFREENK